MQRAELIERLKELQDDEYRKFHLRTCPNAEGLLGVRMPSQRKLAKLITQGDYRQFLSEVQNEFYEETMVEGIVIMSAKIPIAERIGYLRKFVPKINNWAICDSVCNTYRAKPIDTAAMWDFLLEYRKSSAEFELRFMVVMMMNHYLNGEYLQKIFKLLNEIRSNAYYVEMAMAWLLAEALVDYKEETLIFLHDNHLSDFVYNKAIQKACESYRISMEDKNLLRAMKHR